MFENFLISKLSFYLQAQEDMRLPSNKASMFRGGFGNIFKKLNCINKKVNQCSACPLSDNCIYSYIFETSDGHDIPRPYLFEVPFEDKRVYLKGENITFDLLLFGKGIEYATFFIFSFIELGKQGLTKQNFKFTLKEVLDYDRTPIFKDGQIISKVKAQNAADLISAEIPKYNSNKAHLNFISPLRLRENGKLVSKPAFETIVKSLTKRINLISTYHCKMSQPIKNHLDLINKSRDATIKYSNLKWRDWTRYSNRQKTSMQLGGLIGEIVFENVLNEFMPLLILGSYTHIGGGCVFGLGKYALV